MASSRLTMFNSFTEGVLKSIVTQWEAGNVEPVLPTDIPGDVLKAIVDAFGIKIGVPVQITYECGSDYYKVSAITKPKNSTGGTELAEQATSAGTVVKKSKVPRPPNAWILYRQHNHAAVKSAHPGIMNNDISKIIAKMWTAESVESKDRWHAKAIEAKKEHAKKYPGYSYQPRKAGEKKKRMTKRKMALTQSSATTTFSENSPPLTTGSPVNTEVQGSDVHDAIPYGSYAGDLQVTDPQPLVISFDPKEPMMNRMAFNTETNLDTAVSKFVNEMDAYSDRIGHYMAEHIGPAAWHVEASPEALNDYNSAFDFIPFHDDAFVSDLESTIAGGNAVLAQAQDNIADAEPSISGQADHDPAMASVFADLDSMQTATRSLSPMLFGGWTPPSCGESFEIAEVTRQFTLDDFVDFSTVTP